MMYRTINILALFFSLNISAQNATLTGVLINPIDDNLHPITVYAKKYNAEIIYNWSTDSLGIFRADSIEYGLYQFQFQAFKYAITLDSVRVDRSHIAIEIPFPDCKNSNKTGICPICIKNDQVVRIDPYVVHDIWFETKRDSAEYYKKQNSLGYQIEGGKLIWVKSDKLKTKFYDACNFWFCTRDKEIY